MSNSKQLWVQHKTTKQLFIDLVSIEGCTYVAELLKRVKKDKQLVIPQNTCLTLYFQSGAEIKPTDTIVSLGNAGKYANAPLIVKAIPVAKLSRQVATRKMSVEASCRKYMDAIAKRLTEFYEFDYRYKSGVTIGDVLDAKDGVEGDKWKFRRAVTTHYHTDDDGTKAVAILKGQPLKTQKLPDLYTPDEWEKIRKFNTNTSKRVHNAQLPQLSNGKPFIIIPESEFTKEMISFLKEIGVRATLFSSPDDLEIKNEAEFSDSSFVFE